MPDPNPNCFDVLIAGAGFAGSLTALVLHRAGLKVCLVEREKHPRFAIGESSTPVADMILRSLSEKYDLPWLIDFSRYGSWQQAHPEVVCGIKRGFSFFKHVPHREFFTDSGHDNELLVAASSSDTLSDTNWLRADVDAFLVNKVREAGIDYHDLTTIESGAFEKTWRFGIRRDGRESFVEAAFYVDATGGGGLLQQLTGAGVSSAAFHTHSFTLFSHFRNVPRWTDQLRRAGIGVQDFPYDPDFSALHQILDEGWLWMLRFNNERISMGFVLENSDARFDPVPTEKIWDDLLSRYPSLRVLFQGAEIVEPPGRILRSGRLQRMLTPCTGRGWVALPHSAGFVDPMFSSGIALTLSGVEKIADALSEHRQNMKALQESLESYEKGLTESLRLMDCLVAGCYLTMPHFGLFRAWSMLYFAATISHEQRRLRGDAPGYFLNADDPQIREMIYSSFGELRRILQQPIGEDVNRRFTDMIREKIAPYNTARLLDPSLANMYRHTVAVL